MKAITLTQPWATLVAIGAKKIETRSWTTNYRGPLAIHAAKGFPEWARERCFDSDFASKLTLAGYSHVADLPMGAIVATCELIKIIHIAPFTELPVDPEWSFGDYSVGRYMWFLGNIKILHKPIQAKGALGLWEWNSQQ